MDRMLVRRIQSVGCGTDVGVHTHMLGLVCGSCTPFVPQSGRIGDVLKVKTTGFVAPFSLTVLPVVAAASTLTVIIK